MYRIIFQIETQLFLKNTWLPPPPPPPFSFWIPITLAKIFLFLHSHKPRKNTIELVVTVKKNSAFIGPPRHAQIVCAVSKEGTVAKRQLPVKPNRLLSLASMWNFGLLNPIKSTPATVFCCVICVFTLLFLLYKLGLELPSFVIDCK